MEESRNAYNVLGGRHEGKKLPRRPRRRWEDNTKMDLKEVRCDGNWMTLLNIGTNGGLM